MAASLNEGKDDAAIDEYKSAAALDAKLAEPLYSLGRLYGRHGRAAEADERPHVAEHPLGLSLIGDENRDRLGERPRGQGALVC